MSLKFAAASHRYTLDGRHVPGVTTLLGKGLPKPALVYWSAKMVAEFVADNDAAVEQMRVMGRGPMIAALKAVPWESRDQAAIRGTNVHQLAEAIAHGEEVIVPEHLDGAVQGYVRWLDEWNPTVIWTERPVASRKWWYAGTPDALVTINGETWLLDWKSGSGVYGEAAIQTALYSHAEFSVTPDGDEEPLPKIDRLGVVHIRPDGTSLHEVKDPEAAFKDGLHILWTAKAEQRIKGYLTEALPAPAERKAS